MQQLFEVAGHPDAAGVFVMRSCTAYLDSEHTQDAAERERIFKAILNERDQILALGPSTDSWPGTSRR